MKSRVMIIAVLLSALLIVSCSDNSTEPKEADKQIFPTALNNYWDYDDIEYDEEGNVIDESSYRISLPMDTVVNNIRYFGLAYDNELESAVRNKEDGLYMLSHIDQENNIYENLIFKYPAQTGEVFYAGQDDSVTVVSVNVSVTVPAGTFKCYHYRQIREYPDEEFPEMGERYIEDIYACPRLGIVKIEVKASYYSGEFIEHEVEVLTGYELK